MILLDAKATAYHAYHIGEDPDAILSELGNDINTAEYGFNKWMERYGIPLFETDAPVDILIAHDAGVDYRKGIYPEYKMGKSRTDKDPEKTKQMKLLMDMLKRFWAAMGTTQAQVAGVEADDLLAYFCETIPGNHDLYTVDADLLQLQGNHEQVNVLLKCEYQDSGEHKGVPYKYTSFSKSLLGDDSDNYKGINGFGPAKWKHLVDEYGYDGIEELNTCVDTKDYTMLIEAIQETEDKVLKLMYDKRDEWRKSWILAKLHPELCWKPLPAKKKLTTIDWYKRAPSAIAVGKIFKAMGCEDLLEHPDIEKHLPVQWLMTADQIDDALFEEFAAECKNSPVVAFDYETHPSENAMLTNPKGQDFVDVKEALIAGASFTFGANLNSTFYISINHRDTDNCPVSVVKRLLEIAQEHSSLVVQNAFFEIAVTKTNTGMWLDPLYDTRIMQAYVDENEEKHLKGMSSRLLAYNQTSYRDTVWSEDEQRMRTMDELSGEEVLEYGCDDAVVTGHIFILFRIILQIEGTLEFVEQYESCSQHSLVDAYLKGTEIDWEALAAQREVDETAIVDNYKTLRSLLAEHCISPSEKAAKAFVKLQSDYLKKKARQDAKDKIDKPVDKYTEEDTKAVNAAVDWALKAFSKKALAGSMYEDYRSYTEILEFKPTVTQFKEVVMHLEFGVDCFGSTSRKAISEWLVMVQDIDFDSPIAAVEITSEQATFCRLLGDAAGQLAKRKGAAYDSLIAFCADNRIKTGKEVHTGDELNTGSPIQMQHLLYCKLGFPIRLTNMVARGSTRDKLGVREGSPQTDALAMDTALAEDTEEGDWRREAVKCIKAIKEAKTRVSLYHDSYPLWKHASDGRIHPQIKNCGTVTRRPSGTAPNILQVSKHQAGGVMRSIYIPPDDDQVIISIDFAQQELCIMASESEDANLISCYVGDNKRDVHSMTAAGIAKVSYERYMEAYHDDKDKDHEKFLKIRKRPAKATNFLFAYLGEAHTLSQRLIIPIEEAEAMMNSTYETYPDVQPWQESVIKFARQHGYSKTAYGNRRHISEAIFSDNNSENRRMQRQAVNAVIQGGAADILKIVLTNCWLTNLWGSTGATLLAPVYDEITASVPRANAVEYIERLVDIMEITPPDHVVPMTADVSLGANWRDQIEIGVRPDEADILNALAEAV
jgi:DNA polymerase I-like protein with 3'-5' exonuclease and polymerase domains/5'-3' exonuclease